MTIWGYLRVSTDKQNIDNFKSGILDYANEHNLGKVTWIQETVSGRKMWEKRVLGQVFNLTMKSGDIIITSEFSRIGRDFLNSLSFVPKCRERGIRLISLNGDIPQSDTATDNLLLAVTAFKNQQERENIAFRTRQGLRTARERGVRLGRTPGIMGLDRDANNERIISGELAQNIKLKQIAKNHHVTPLTLRRYVRKHKLVVIKDVEPKSSS